MLNFNQKKDDFTENLRKQLESAGIDTSIWGTGQAKTLTHLQNEIQDGETVLITDQTGKIIRQVLVGVAIIYYDSPDGKKYQLREDKQIFKDGRQRKRNLKEAVSEKMKPNENPTEAMSRGISEELGISSKINLTKLGVDEKTFTSPSYPGLVSKYVYHRFQVMLDDEQFNPKGYIENQSDKSTYFIWKAI